MASTALPNATTTSIAKGLKAHFEEKGVRLKHADILAGIARGLGFSSPQALRGEGRKIAGGGKKEPDGPVAGYLTRLLLEVVCENDDLGSGEVSLDTLGNLMSDIEDDQVAGHVRHLETISLDETGMTEKCEEIGWSPEFFMPAGMDEADEEEEEETKDAGLLAGGAHFYVLSGALLNGDTQEKIADLSCESFGENEADALRRARIQVQRGPDYDPETNPVIDLKVDGMVIENDAGLQDYRRFLASLPELLLDKARTGTGKAIIAANGDKTSLRFQGGRGARVELDEMDMADILAICSRAIDTSDHIPGIPGYNVEGHWSFNGETEQIDLRWAKA